MSNYRTSAGLLTNRRRTNLSDDDYENWRECRKQQGKRSDQIDTAILVAINFLNKSSCGGIVLDAGANVQIQKVFLCLPP